jgi:hypothetical protein
MLLVSGEKIELIGSGKMRIFRYGLEATETGQENDLRFLLG